MGRGSGQGTHAGGSCGRRTKPGPACLELEGEGTSGMKDEVLISGAGGWLVGRLRGRVQEAGGGLQSCWVRGEQGQAVTTAFHSEDDVVGTEALDGVLTLLPGDTLGGGAPGAGGCAMELPWFPEACPGKGAQTCSVLGWGSFLQTDLCSGRCAELLGGWGWPGPWRGVGTAASSQDRSRVSGTTGRTWMPRSLGWGPFQHPEPGLSSLTKKGSV